MATFTTFIRKIVRTGLTAKDAVANLKKHLQTLVQIAEKEANEETVEEEAKQTAQNKVADDLAQIRFMMIGDTETPPAAENPRKLTKYLLATETTPKDCLLIKIIRNGRLYAPDAQKEMANIFNFILRHHTDTFKTTFQKEYNSIVDILLDDYADGSRPRLQVQISSILKEIMKDEELHTFLLYECPRLRILLFQNVKETNFDVSSDAFTTLKQLLTKNKKVIAKFLEQNYVDFFEEYNALINSENYVTRRQSLKLLGDVLLDKDNKATMMRYIGEKKNLKLLMMMLRDSSKAITFEAFHVFKVFVANPHKQPEVYSVLYKNKDKLIKFLNDFQTQERQEDNQFIHEKKLLVDKLKKMTKTPEEYEIFFDKKSKNKQAKQPSKPAASRPR